MPDEIRCRFAPSPTGYMHVGNLHTALFNWLFCRHVGGKFVLRIEDTDEVRSTEAALGVIYDGLRWLGLDWDEGPDIGGPYAPYVQSERLSIYQDYFDRLLEADLAYRCYCTREELDEMRQIQQAGGKPPRYDGRCRALTPASGHPSPTRALTPVPSPTGRGVAEGRGEGSDACIRLKMREVGSTVINDLIQGEVTYENALAGDPVICKTSGFPTYHFAVVVDDYLMQITHVIRAVEHLPNAQIHIQLQDALGFPRPVYAHLPIVLGADKTKLSKRHGAVSVTEYEQMGYLPEAMLNFLALMGWSPASEQEIFPREEIIKRFTLEACSKSPAVFDLEKAEWLNGEYIKQLTPEELAQRALPYLQRAGLFEQSPAPERLEWLVKVCALMQERVRLLTVFTDWARYFFTEEFDYEDRAREKWLCREDIPGRLEALADRLAVTDWNAEALEAAVRGLAEEMGLKAAELIHPCRAGATGTTIGPSLFHLLELLPRENVVARLRRAADLSRRGELAPRGEPEA